MSGYPQSLVPVDHVEPVPRRIRAELGGRVVLDTTAALYLWEWPPYPQFLIPVGDVDPDALVDEERVSNLSRGRVARVGLRVGDVERPGAGRRYVESTIPGIVGTIRFDFAALDAWYEEDEQVFVHPRNPYARVDALRSTRRVRIELGGVVLAESSGPVLVFETGLPTRYYLNRTEVRLENLVPTDTVTACPYKGTTSGYWSVQLGAQRYDDLAWTYDFPTRELLPIAGLIAFYNERVDLFVDGEAVPRPVTHFS
jgi:uncharacterized protein (DUF427 family)